MKRPHPKTLEFKMGQVIYRTPSGRTQQVAVNTVTQKTLNKAEKLNYELS